MYFTTKTCYFTNLVTEDKPEVSLSSDLSYDKRFVRNCLRPVNENHLL